MTPTIDLNADLGEGFPNDDRLLDLVTSASVCCGAHAGDRETILATLSAAKRKGVAVGAHPGYPDREGFGRVERVCSAAEVTGLILDQFERLKALADAVGVTLRFVADANHFHHRMARIGFSQRKTLAYLYAWTLLLAGVAVALRFVPYHDHAYPHRYHAGWAAVMIVLVLIAIAASVYLIYVLEIFKFKRLRVRDIRQAEPATSEHEIEVRVQREVETGEFETVG